jgi:hypothetical protein
MAQPQLVLLQQLVLLEGCHQVVADSVGLVGLGTVAEARQANNGIDQ